MDIYKVDTYLFLSTGEVLRSCSIASRAEWIARQRPPQRGVGWRPRQPRRLQRLLKMKDCRRIRRDVWPPCSSCRRLYPISARR